MPCPFSKFKDFFGKPGEGVHQYKFMGVAIVDLLLSIVLAIIVSHFTTMPHVLSIITVLLLGLVLHVLFGVPTQAVKWLGLAC